MPLDPTSIRVTASAHGDQTQVEANASKEKTHALQQYAAEFLRPPRTWWDSLVDGFNRLIRPVIVCHTLFFMILVVTNPQKGQVIALALSTIPEALWWIIGSVILFYFGSRMTEKIMINRTTGLKQFRNALEQIKEINTISYKEQMQSERKLPSIKSPLHPFQKEGVDQIKKHEGLRLKVYKDSLGIPTIGYGRNLKDRGISTQEAEVLLLHDLKDHIQGLLAKAPWIKTLSTPRKWVLYNMAFNLGIQGLLSFKKTLSLIKEGQYKKASRNMLKSKWAKQVHNRANHLAEQMQTGKWVLH